MLDLWYLTMFIAGMVSAYGVLKDFKMRFLSVVFCLFFSSVSFAQTCQDLYSTFAQGGRILFIFLFLLVTQRLIMKINKAHSGLIVILLILLIYTNRIIKVLAGIFIPIF